MCTYNGLPATLPVMHICLKGQYRRKTVLQDQYSSVTIWLISLSHLNGSSKEY